MKRKFLWEVISIPRYNFDEDFMSKARAIGWSICDFEEWKENKKMTMLEMLNKAETNGKTNYDYDMRYNKKYGFHDGEGDPWKTKLFDSVNEIFEGDNWEELDPEEDVDYKKPMSIEEIEGELGYKIKIVSKK